MLCFMLPSPPYLALFEFLVTNLSRQCRWSILIGLIIVVALSGAAWVFSPKGETQTYVQTLHIFAICVSLPLRFVVVGQDLQRLDGVWQGLA